MPVKKSDDVPKWRAPGLVAHNSPRELSQEMCQVSHLFHCEELAARVQADLERLGQMDADVAGLIHDIEIASRLSMRRSAPRSRITICPTKMLSRPDAMDVPQIPVAAGIAASPRPGTTTLGGNDRRQFV